MTLCCSTGRSTELPTGRFIPETANVEQGVVPLASTGYVNQPCHLKLCGEEDLYESSGDEYYDPDEDDWWIGDSFDCDRHYARY